MGMREGRACRDHWQGAAYADAMNRVPPEINP